MAGNRYRGLRGAAVLGLAVLAGCQPTADSRPAPTLAGDSESPVRLTAAQVADMRVALARTLEHRGEVEQARLTYAGALEKDPKRVDACIRLANLHARRGQFAEATDLYRRALEFAPANADVYCNMGYNHYLAEQWDEAEQTLRTCLSIKPDHRRAHNNLGLVLARLGRGDEALAEFGRAGCSDSDGRLNLAYARTLTRDWTGARQQYEHVLARDPKSASARKGLERVEGLAQRLGGDGDWPALAGRPAPAGGEPYPPGADPTVVPAKAERPVTMPAAPAERGRPEPAKAWAPQPFLFQLK